MFFTKKLEKKIFPFLFTLFLLQSSFSFAQEISVEIGEKEIALNQAFTISIVVENGTIENYDRFPEIEGFVKRGKSNATTEVFRNGQRISSQSIIQNYAPTKEGLFQMQAFSITVNNKRISTPGTLIRVGPPNDELDNPLSYEDFFDEIEFVEVKEDAFLGISTDKEEVSVGEGFTLTLAFYVATTNKAYLEFYELGSQLTEILKTLKPTNCWEEDFDIRELQREEVNIQGKKYYQYKIFQAAYYPFNTESIVFPEVSLKMIKYKVVKNETSQATFGPDKIPDYKLFFSQPKKITVRPLPEHPLKDAVSVGQFYVEESITKLQVTTGSSYDYQFIIGGEGNFSAIKAPEILENPHFEFYPIDTKELINRADGKVTGRKIFNYKLVPKQAGKYPLNNYIRWVYFDAEKQQYDTLSSKFVLEISGENSKNLQISGNLPPFYQKIDTESNLLGRLHYQNLLRILANTTILVMLAFTTYMMFKK